MTLNAMRWMAAALLAAVAFSGCAMPEEAREDDAATEEPTILTPEELTWQDGPASLPPGARVAALSGDPAAEGVFTLRLELPAGYRIDEHTHGATEHVTVLSGSPSVVLGADEANATQLSPGSFFAMPPGTEHAFFTGDEPTVIQLHGEGPWGIEYLEEDTAGGA